MAINRTNGMRAVFLATAAGGLLATAALAECRQPAAAQSGAHQWSESGAGPALDYSARRDLQP